MRHWVLTIKTSPYGWMIRNFVISIVIAQNSDKWSRKNRKEQEKGITSDFFTVFLKFLIEMTCTCHLFCNRNFRVFLVNFKHPIVLSLDIQHCCFCMNKRTIDPSQHVGTRLNLEDKSIGSKF